MSPGQVRLEDRYDLLHPRCPTCGMTLQPAQVLQFCPGCKDPLDQVVLQRTGRRRRTWG